ncbi:ethylene-responsive transcription factor ERF012-like [Nymphaea colorata]|nr:ethylene-responsive transcription factor ERF012-like [Nymphaea colorata]
MVRHGGAPQGRKHTKYKGVRMRSWGSWVSEIRAPHQKTRIWLGSYATPEAAARAYDAALLCLKGATASFNFPESAARRSVPDTLLSPKSIQRVAAAAAAASDASCSFADDASSSQSSTMTPQPPPRPTPPATFASSSSDLGDGGIDAWVDDYDLESAKCLDHFFASPIVEEVDEVADISLWSFS